MTVLKFRNLVNDVGSYLNLGSNFSLQEYSHLCVVPGVKILDVVLDIYVLGRKISNQKIRLRPAPSENTALSMKRLE